MQLIPSRTLIGTALLLATRFAAAQTDPFSVRVERVDVRPDVLVQESPTVEFRTLDDSDDPAAKPQINKRARVMVSKQGAGQTMGMYVSPVPPALAAQLRLRPRTGMVVEGVAQGSPAEHAGIQQYDVIERIDDQSITSPQQAQKMFGGHQPGDEVSVSVIREGKRRTVSMALGDTPEPRPVTREFKFAPDFKFAPNALHVSPDAFQFSTEQRQKLGEISSKVQEDVQKHERQIEELTARIRAEAEQARQQIQELKNEIRQQAKQEMEQAMRKLKEAKDKQDNHDDDRPGF